MPRSVSSRAPRYALRVKRAGPPFHRTRVAAAGHRLVVDAPAAEAERTVDAEEIVGRGAEAALARVAGVGAERVLEDARRHAVVPLLGRNETPWLPFHADLGNGNVQPQPAGIVAHDGTGNQRLHVEARGGQRLAGGQQRLDVGPEVDQQILADARRRAGLRRRGFEFDGPAAQRHLVDVEIDAVRAGRHEIAAPKAGDVDAAAADAQERLVEVDNVRRWIRRGLGGALHRRQKARSRPRQQAHEAARQTLA